MFELLGDVCGLVPASGLQEQSRQLFAQGCSRAARVRAWRSSPVSLSSAGRVAGCEWAASTLMLGAGLPVPRWWSAGGIRQLAFEVGASSESVRAPYGSLVRQTKGRHRRALDGADELSTIDIGGGDLALGKNQLGSRSRVTGELGLDTAKSSGRVHLWGAGKDGFGGEVASVTFDLRGPVSPYAP